jgi:hypothetical protein
VAHSPFALQIQQLAVMELLPGFVQTHPKMVFLGVMPFFYIHLDNLFCCCM